MLHSPSYSIPCKPYHILLNTLHSFLRLRFLGKVLSVERASRPTENSKNQCEAAQVKKESTSSTNDAPLGKDPSAEAKIGSLPAGSEPIAERLGVDYPFPPHLEYAYPPPDGNILTNILNALIAVPRFYTQVSQLLALSKAFGSVENDASEVEAADLLAGCTRTDLYWCVHGRS